MAAPSGSSRHKSRTCTRLLGCPALRGLERMDHVPAQPSQRGPDVLLDVYECDNGPWVAYNEGVSPAGEYEWYRFNLTTVAGQHFTKGKQYEFRFTRSGSGSDSINYFYQNDEPYEYGDIMVDGDIVIARDLCMRLYCSVNPVDSMDFACDEVDTARPRLEHGAVRRPQRVALRAAGLVALDVARHGRWGRLRDCRAAHERAQVGEHAGRLVSSGWFRRRREVVVRHVHLLRPARVIRHH